MRLIFLCTAFLLTAHALAVAADPVTPAFATNADPTAAWKGVAVLPRLDAIVKAGDVTIVPRTVPWIVQDINGELLWVGDYRKGWVQRSQVVTLDEAPTYYTQVIDSGNNLNWAYNLRAIAWRHKGYLELAIADFGEKLRIAPDAAGYNNRGTVWHRKKNYERAIADFDQAIRLNPDHAMAYSNRGSSWRAMKDYDKAIADFNKAIQLDLEYEVAYYNRGWTWHLKKEFDKALVDYHHAISLDPNDAWPYNATAWLRATSPDERYRNGTIAVDFATTACELSGWKDAFNVGTLGAACAEVGDFDSAIKYQQRAIDLKPDDAEFVKGAKERLALYEKHKPYREE